MVALLDEYEPEFYAAPPYECTNVQFHNDGSRTWDPEKCTTCVHREWLRKMNNLAYFHKCLKPPKDPRALERLCVYAIRYRRGERGHYGDSGDQEMMNLSKRKRKSK